MSIKIAVGKEHKYKVPPEVAEGSKNVALLYVEPYSRMLLTEVTKYQKNGVMSMSQADGVSAMLNLLDDCIVGWEGIQDDKGKKLEFKKDYVEFLPFELQMDFINSVLVPKWSKMDPADPSENEEGKELGN